MTTSFFKLFILLPLLCIVLFGLDIFFGSVHIPFSDIFQILIKGSHSQESWQIIILNFRFPRAITAFLAGGGLALSGLLMQTLFRNSLAGPFVLGISSGSSLGVALVLLGGPLIFSGVGQWLSMGTATAAMLGSGGMMLFISLLAKKIPSNTTLLILGLMLGYFSGALVNFLIYFSNQENLQMYVLWTLGNFTETNFFQISILAVCLCLGTVLSLWQVKSLNGMLLGENYATSMGISVPKTRMVVVITTSLLAGSITAFCGPIAFLGLAVPHLCRGLFPSKTHLTLIPAVLLLGGSMALAADIISQLPGSQKTLPLNSVTALIGAPIIFWVIVKNRYSSSGFKA